MFVVTFILLVGLHSTAEGLTCLQCNNVTATGNCKSVRECNLGEVCGVERVAPDLFNVGCMKQGKCSSTPAAQGCIECCNSTICNDNGCGKHDHSQNQGPVCYDCPVQTNSSPCHTIDYCSSGQKCYIFESMTDLGSVMFASRCIEQSACSEGNFIGGTIVGRDIQPVCKNCCDKNLCNLVCNHSVPAVSIPRDCYDILHMKMGNRNGVYNVTLRSTNQTIQVYCDMETDGGGWTVFQSRVNGSVNFNRSFAEYERGFGSLYGEFWLGLMYVQEMAAAQLTELRLDLTSANDSTAYEVFTNFSLGPKPNYTLHIEPGNGTAGDNATGLSYHNGFPFATYDHPDAHKCAVLYYQAWWFDQCFYVNLNGEYLPPGTYLDARGIIYDEYIRLTTLKATQMKFRKL